MKVISKKGYRGYCTHNPFGEYRMPVPAQNILYREYSNRLGLHFKLSVNELFFPDCFLNLFSLLKELEEIEGVLMSSIFMLPSDQVLRSNVYQLMLDQDSEIHFVLENIIISTQKDIDNLELIFQLRQLLPDITITKNLSMFKQ